MYTNNVVHLVLLSLVSDAHGSHTMGSLGHTLRGGRSGPLRSWPRNGRLMSVGGWDRRRSIL